jgi:hypothetical protein
VRRFRGNVLRNRHPSFTMAKTGTSAGMHTQTMQLPIVGFDEQCRTDGEP